MISVIAWSATWETAPAAALRNTPEYDNLKTSRNEATHRLRTAKAQVGASAALSITYGGADRPVLELTEEIGAYGREKFRELCHLLLSWVPEGSDD
ncbi:MULTISPECIES: hypothetical protein [unclassified Streptomyces]|uniref:Uncharacterized protein n=1 Tax=Streptomyces sp. NBC_00060 TaxID=2975636 RepID=A0AAU2HAC4_9ACTN